MLEKRYLLENLELLAIFATSLGRSFRFFEQILLRAFAVSLRRLTSFILSQTTMIIGELQTVFDFIDVSGWEAVIS